MKVYTYEEIRDKVLKDLDMQDESFVDQDEMVGYCNDAIDEAEEEILKLSEDYFLTYSALNLIAAKSEYSLPADMYANKIREIVFSDGSLIYEVKKFRRPKQFTELTNIEVFGNTDYYKYLLLNQSATKGYKIKFYPNIRETGSEFIKIWYIRNAQRVPLIADGSLTETEETKVDIPEFHGFIVDYMKERVLFKEGGPRYEAALLKLEKRRTSMVSTLTERVDDDDNEIPQDVSHYEEHS